jgi:protein DGCR14
MFPPDADSNPHDHRKPPPDGIVPKLINLSSTRMEEDDPRPSRGASEPPSPTRSRIDAAIAGTPCKLSPKKRK